MALLFLSSYCSEQSKKETSENLETKTEQKCRYICQDTAVPFFVKERENTTYT
jgi:hypothetical protein